MDGTPHESSDLIAPNMQLDEDALAMQSLIERMRQDQTKLEARQEQVQQSPSSLYSIRGLGRFMQPSQNSYAAHLDLIRDASLALSFHPGQQPVFDAYLSVASQWQEPMAVLRNFLLAVAASDASTAKLKMQHMARYCQLYMRSDHVIEPSGKGMQTLYRLLLQRQQTPLLFMPSEWLSPLRPSKWNLPAIEQSPFSDAALSMAAPGPSTQISNIETIQTFEMVDRNSKDAMTMQAEEEQHVAHELNDIANDMASAGALTMSVEELHEPTRRESIEIAKEILDKLRVKMGEAFISHGLELFEAEKLSILGSLKEVVKAFEFHLHKVAGLDAKIYENPAVIRANEAVGKLSYLAKNETLLAAKQLGDSQMAALIEADLSQFPKSWMPNDTETFGGLFDDLESGLKAVLDRINQIGDQDHTAEFWLGFSSEKSIGSVDPSKGAAGKQEKTMHDDQYYRQLNAQRALRARQAAIRYTQSMQRLRVQDHHEEHHHSTTPQKPTGLSGLLSSDMVNSMRNAMKTNANAAQVETGAQANVKQVINQKEQTVKAQRQRVTVEQVTRANKRNQDMRDDKANQTPPPHKKKDHGHGF